MSTVVEQATYSPEELLQLPNGGKGFELVDGRLAEKSMGALASWVERLGEEQELTAPDLIPGFRQPVSALFTASTG